MNPLVSIIIPCYNDIEYIEKSVNSILKQTYSKIEIIVIDDGSNLITKRILKKIEPKIYKLITQDNKGVVSARNKGIENSRGEYIMTLDSDDYAESDFIEKAVKFLNDNNDYGVVTSHYKVFNKTRLKRNVFLENRTTLKDFLLRNRVSSNAVFRRLCWDQCGGYDPLFNDGFEDWDFWINISSKGWKFEILNEYLLIVNIKEISRNKSAMKLDYYLKKKLFYKYDNFYKVIFDDFVESQFNELIQLKKTLKKRDLSLEMQIGNFILMPLRKFKKLFRLFGM